MVAEVLRTPPGDPQLQKILPRHCVGCPWSPDLGRLPHANLLGGYRAEIQGGPVTVHPGADLPDGGHRNLRAGYGRGPATRHKGDLLCHAYSLAAGALA